MSVGRRLFEKLRWVAAAALALTVGASSAMAETLLMPPRDYLAGSPEVVWGVTTQANGTAFVLDYGDGSQQSGNVTDRSYIAFQKTYALANTYTVQLCVGPGAVIPGCPGELTSVQVRVFNGGVLSAEDLRNLNINRAIQSALRYLWVNQSNRTTFDTTIETGWGNFALPFTALAVLAFENHGFTLPNNNNAPTGIFPKYAVRRGFNYILARLTTINLGVTPAGNDPCVSVPAPVCSGLSAQTTGDPGYENALAILPFAGSNALLRQNLEVATANVANKTFGEILQRMVNATIWGQNDSGNGRGGWYYTYNNTSSDGSTVGWDLLALLDADAAGATVPQWVRTEWSNTALPNAINDDGTFDYQANANRANRNSVNIAKTGVGIQGMFFAGRPNNHADLANALNFISTNWTGVGGSQSFICQGGVAYNKGCAYGMFNVFKGLRLYGFPTLPGVNRPAGPGAIPQNDWYADYVDWLVTNQTAPGTTTGGHWANASPNNLSFSSQTSNDPTEAAIALLILSDTALIAPDPDLFSTVGLKHGNPLTTDPDTNPVNTPHTVVAKAQSAGGASIPGVTISFQMTGRNGAIVLASGVTDVNGEVSRTYTDAGPAGSGGADQIRAFIGQVGSNLASNTLVKNWVAPQGLVCDTDNDGDVDSTDVQNIRNRNGQAAGAGDPHDPNGDGRINVADARFCQLRIPR